MSAFDMILELIKNVKIGIMRKMEKKKMTQEDIMKLLDSCYEKCLNGIPMVSPGIEDMANDYLSKHETKEKACRDMLKKSNCQMYNIRSCNRTGWLYNNASCDTGEYRKCNLCTNADDSLYSIYGGL